MTDFIESAIKEHDCCCGQRAGFNRDDCERCSLVNEVRILKERGERLESVINWALSVQRRNTKSWMDGLANRVNAVLTTDGDARRCIVDSGHMLLVDVRDRRAHASVL